jgi:hypothetical protein
MQPQTKTTAIPGWVPILVTIGLGLTTIICLWIAGTRQLTNTESVLLGVLLSAASMLVSWLATHVYSVISVKDSVAEATQAYSDNIRTLGVRAAEKVLNLSNQLQRLSESMNSALEDADESDGTKQSIVQLLRERIQAAIYNLETLKSMNDTFLSDWRGIIGDEIDKQQALERQIEVLALELRNQIRERESMRSAVVSNETVSALEDRIYQTEQRLTEKITALPFKVTVRSSKTAKEDVSLKCPSCTESISVLTRTKKGARKLIHCPSCKTYSRICAIEDGDFEIDAVTMFTFSDQCPICHTELKGEMPDYSGAMQAIVCPKCDMSLIASRASDGINLRVPKGEQHKFPKSLYDAVFSRLPPRPWPPFIHKAIAAELGISNKVVSQIIGRIVESGHFPIPVQETVQTQIEK